MGRTPTDQKKRKNRAIEEERSLTDTGSRPYTKVRRTLTMDKEISTKTKKSSMEKFCMEMENMALHTQK